MEWKQKGGKIVPAATCKVFEDAAKEFDVPVGILLGTVECETNFRLGLVSSLGAVGPCQFLPDYQNDYFRYAGFKFDLTGWDSVRGMAAVYKFYAKLGATRYGFADADLWRYALLAHRYGQASAKATKLYRAARIKDVESGMERNNLWYDGEKKGSENNGLQEEVGKDNGRAQEIAKGAAKWALSKVGCPYDQSRRTREAVFDCSSLVARAYSAQGVDWDKVGHKVPLSCEEVYSDQFELLWPEDYAHVGKKFGGTSLLQTAKAGDIQFVCTNKKTTRTNLITHVVMDMGNGRIVHARGKNYGVVNTSNRLYSGSIVAVCRYNPDVKLRQGMKGLRVVELQKRLNKLGAGLTLDGDYGKKTAAAVEKYGGEA